jgi:hypothetical protein
MKEFLLSLLVLLVSWKTVSSSGFVCSGSWEVDQGDAPFVFNQFQKWIYAWQHNCRIGRKYFTSPSISTASFAASYHNAADLLMMSMEAGTIFRPHSGRWGKANTFQWADVNEAACTLGLRSLDCYFEPVTPCNTDQMDKYMANVNDAQVKQDLARFNFPDAQDSCTIAKTLKKSMVWVYGSLLHYLFRPSQQIQWPVYQRIISAFTDDAKILSLDTKPENYPATYYEYEDQVLSAKKEFSTLGVQIGGGTTEIMYMRGKKKHSISLDRLFYPWEFVDTIAERLASQGKPLKYVYFTSDSVELPTISAAYLTKAYPRAWKYILLPRINPTKYEDPKLNQTITVENLADIEILATTDFFIGSWSFYYQVVQGLRVARGLVDPKSTCLIDNREPEITTTPVLQVSFPMFCGDDQKITENWKLRGFQGPSLLS